MAELKRAFLSNIPVLIAGAVAIIAAGAWIMSSIWVDDDAAQATKPVAAKAGTTDGSPPMRALPPPGTDLLPPVRTPPSEPLTSQQAGAPPAAAPETPVKPAKVAPGLPVTPAAPSAETAQPTPPVQTAKRAERAVAEAAGISSGKYVGNISGGEAAGLTLVISSVEGGAVKGTASVAGGGVCDDNYPMQGNMRAGKLELRATRMGGRAGDCPLSLSLAVAGDRLTGATGSGGGVQLSKK